MDEMLVNHKGLAVPSHQRKHHKQATSLLSYSLTPELEKERERKRLRCTRNFRSENIRQIRLKEAEQRLKKKKQLDKEGQRGPFVPPRNLFQGKAVESRFLKDAEEKGRPESNQRHSFLKKHERLGKPSNLKTPVVTRPGSAGLRTFHARPPSRDDDLGLVIQGAATGERSSSRHTSRPCTGSSCNKKPGDIPKYLKNMRAEQHAAEEEAKERAKDPKCPRGHKRLSKESLNSILNHLTALRYDLTNQLQMLPLSRDTLRLHDYREALEADIFEIEEAIAYLQHHTVREKVDLTT
eukprot:gene8091-10098_t